MAILGGLPCGASAPIDEVLYTFQLPFHGIKPRPLYPYTVMDPNHSLVCLLRKVESDPFASNAFLSAHMSLFSNCFN